MSQNTVLWVYIILLVAGGLFGFFKAGSKASLISAGVSAALLAVASIPGLFAPGFSRILIAVLLAALLVVFTIRLSKTRKFMPSGLMLVLTLLVLVLRMAHF
jgi:uncharacterized membrane protein (UPF0136 family)